MLIRVTCSRHCVFSLMLESFCATESFSVRKHIKNECVCQRMTFSSQFIINFISKQKYCISIVCTAVHGVAARANHKSKL